MGIFRSFSEIVNSIIERLRLVQPNLDTKPGTVARDVFIDIPADQIEKLHSSLVLVSEKQSPESALGKDLDKWASNFGIARTPGSPANGIVVFTINDIVSDLQIPSGTVVVARNGLQFKTIGNYLMSSAEKSRFSATANRLRSSLDLAGISDRFAIEVPVRASAAGTSGNISSFQITEHTLTDPLKITNLKAFRDGLNLESDAAFKSKVFSIFSGSNTGTAFGYRNAALSIQGVNDAVVIEPGNTLMLRDGTETIQINDGSFRILNSGTGGKVDLYILGSQLEEVVESYIFTDKSGNGDASDERNDFILGQSNLDPTLTSTERRVNAFKNGILPKQPADSLISVIGSSTGVLSEQSIDDNGVVSGNYVLVKDLNVDTGGSPFGFDKLRFISSEKEVEAENIVKQSINSIDALRFSGTSDLIGVFQNISIIGENSTVSSADKTVVKLNHYPVVTVNRVTNRTTGEVYVIESQNLNSDSGLNENGQIIISGKTLPSSADVLSVDYVWRLYYDKFIDYNGVYTGIQVVDSNVSDSIDWGTPNGILAESTIIEKTDDDLEFQIKVGQNISRVLSVYSAESVNATISLVENSGGMLVSGIILSNEDEVITNIISIKNDSGVELYTTLKQDGSFSSRTIILPSDSPGSTGNVIVFYNKIELYQISNSDGAFANDIITLPSTGILDGNNLLETVSSLFLTEDEVFVDYIAEINNIIPSQSLINLPINGSNNSNVLLNSGLTTITGSNQPIFYNYDSSGNILGVERFGPTRLAITATGITRPGKIKLNGETLTRLQVEITAGIDVNGLQINLSSGIKAALGINTIPASLGIARIDEIISDLNSDLEVDLIGQQLQTNVYGFGIVEINENLNNVSLILPDTSNNNLLSFEKGEKLTLNLLIYNNNDFEDLYFSGNGRVISNKVFARIIRISVSSGFRTPAGSLVGSIVIIPQNQPGVGLSYFANYKFKAPIEGERITVRYNLNRLIGDVTANLETVRSITADVLVKESPRLDIDIRGEIIINQDFITETSTVLENVSNAVVNLINSSILGGVVDYSDIINSATSIPGVDSLNISRFNESGKVGKKSFIKALDNQSLSAGEIQFKAISRKDFRIT